MDGILNFRSYWLMERDSCMTLQRTLLLLVLVLLLFPLHALHLLSFACLSLSHHHFLLLPMKLEVVTLSNLSFSQLMFAHLPVAQIPQLSFTVGVLG